MHLPDDINTDGVNEETDLTLLDEQILKILRESEGPIVTSKEVSETEGVKSTRRTVHKHLGELEKLGLVACKSNDTDNSPKVWWIPEERIITADEETPTDGEISLSDVTEGLEAMESSELRQVCFNVDGIEPATPRLLQLAKYAFYGGWILIFIALVANDIGLPYNLADWFLLGFLVSILASFVFGVIHYARTLPRICRRVQTRLPDISRLDWNLSQFRSG